MSTQASTDAPPVTPSALAPAQQPQQRDNVAPLEVDYRVIPQPRSNPKLTGSQNTDTDSSYGDEMHVFHHQAPFL
jgi:hypothetical protein